MNLQRTPAGREGHAGSSLGRRTAVKVVIRLSAREEVKALSILLRHSPGMVLAERTYVVSDGAARTLRERGIEFTELCRDGNAPGLGGVLSGERI
jgi:hypothetical protein